MAATYFALDEYESSEFARQFLHGTLPDTPEIDRKISTARAQLLRDLLSDAMEERYEVLLASMTLTAARKRQPIMADDDIPF